MTTKPAKPAKKQTRKYKLTPRTEFSMALVNLCQKHFNAIYQNESDVREMMADLVQNLHMVIVYGYGDKNANMVAKETADFLIACCRKSSQSGVFARYRDTLQ